MIEVTQADRNFAAPWIAQSVQSFSERSAYRKEIEAGEHDAHPMVIAAATHRTQAAKAERDRIVAWLLDAPNDWPFTGNDIANLIAAGMPAWLTLEHQP